MSVTVQTVYLVLRWHWRVWRDNTEEVAPGDPRPDVRPNPHQPGAFEIVTYLRNPDENGYPVRAFRDHGRALAYCREQEAARRATTNPFRYGTNLESRTSLDVGRLSDWLIDVGLTPPGPRWEEKPELIHAAWERWWKKVREGLSEERRVSLAEAVRRARSEQWSGDADDGTDDLGWLDEQFQGVERWPMLQR